MNIKKNNTNQPQEKQVIVTGNPVSGDLAEEIRTFLSLGISGGGYFALDWCHPDGTIGYLDNSLIPVSPEVLREHLQKIGERFPQLNLGVTLMTGPKGGYNSPVISFYLSGGKVIKKLNAHIEHPAPRRMKTPT